MSKLDGNERWNSKMLMTEHQEQYDSRHEIKYTGPTPEELIMLRDYILLPHLLTMVQHNKEDIDSSSLLLKKLYQIATQVLMDRISKDIYALRREFSRRSIKVFADEQEDVVYYFKYICRGYENKFGIIREVMRAELSVKLTAYLADIYAVLKENK
ncbi:MAG: hypothetical protein K6T85_11305 [Gorillibacterium sp.]|nr:hypothetical protein [Gorillibacterium sp.]